MFQLIVAQIQCYPYVFILTILFYLFFSYLFAACLPGWLCLMTVFCTFHLILSFGVPSINCLKVSTQIDSSSRSQMFSASSYKGYSNDNNSESSYVPDNDMGLAENHSQAGEDFSLVPSADDIEKYVHLNQDGSMTVEMRVRFNIKEEETIKWTTSVSRAGTSTMVTEPSSELNILTSEKAIENFSSAENGISLQQITTEVTNQDSICQTETNNYDIWQNPSMNIDASQTNNDHAKPYFYRPPTPGPRRIRQKKARVESVTVVSDTAVQKKLVGQFSYSEETDNCETTSEYCVVTHASSKTSNVINPELSEVCSGHNLKQLQDNHTEEKRFSTDTMRRSFDLPDEDSPLQHVLETGVVEEGCDSSFTHALSSLEKYHAAGQPLSKQSGGTGREAGSFNKSLELSLLKNEGVLCNQCKELYLGQVSVHPPSPEGNKIVCKCTQISPSIKGPSTTITENDSVETITATQLSDESRAASSGSKKKRKKKKKTKTSADAMKQGMQENLHDPSVKGISENEVQTSEMNITRGSAQHSSAQITPHKRGIAFPIGNLDSAKNLGTKEDLHNQVLEKPQQNESASNLKKNINRQLPKLKAKSEKKRSLSPSAKAEEKLLLIKNESNYEVELMKEGSCDTTGVTEQTPTHFIKDPSKMLIETENGERENEKIPSQMLPMKHRKAKKNKKLESELGSEVNTPDEGRVLGALRHTYLSDEITEYSLENYVQSWLQNIFPDVVRPEQHLAPIYSNDRKKHQLSVKSFSEKDIRLTGKNIGHTQRNNIINDGKQSNRTVNKLSEIDAVEESVKKLYDRHIGCLTDATAILTEEAKHLLQSDIQNNTISSLCNIIQENDEKKVQLDADDQMYISEIVAQIHAKPINNLLGPDVQKDCVNSLLLHELKSAILTAEKNSIGCATKSTCTADLASPSLLCSSPNLLLAWLLLLNLKEILPSINKDDTVQTTCRCSEMLALLKYLKQAAVKEEADALKTAVCNTENCTANCLIPSAVTSEMQEPICCQENISLAEIKNIPDADEQRKVNQNLMLNNTIDCEETEVAKELSEELKKSTEKQMNDCMLAENEDLNELDVHNERQNLDCNPAQSHHSDLTSNEELLKENEVSSLFESQEKHTDTSLNNEESEISEEPKSTSHSTASQDRDHIFDLETSELDEKEVSTEEKEWKKQNSTGYPTSTAENAATDRLEDSVQDDLEENGACEETSERLSTPSPLSFCYESKQIPVDACEEEPTSRVKLIVKELECGSHSYSSLEFKKCLKSPASSDLSDYRPETDESCNNFRPSSDLTNDSADEAMYEKEYNKGYVKRTIERLYGKTGASFTPASKPGPLYLSQAVQKDSTESFHAVIETAPSFSHVCNSWAGDQMPSSQVPHEVLEDLNKASKMWEKENATLPAPQFSLNGEKAYCDDDCSVQYMNQHNHSQVHCAEDEGVLIDKGKWLLKENHLIRRSPPENIGMCGNADTTSTDTVLDNHSDDIPYSHFGNLDQQLPLKDISSSELEDMAKPCDNGCNYFNMPHNSDSELFPDALSTNSKSSQNGSNKLPLGAMSKICTSSTQIFAEGNTPAFTSVEFRLPDNKVHPLQETPNDEPIQTQPNSNANSNRNNREDQDSLDKLHAICGQHCPILTAIIKPTNEEIRGCAYRKASDVENQVGLHLLMDTTSLWYPLSQRWHGKILTGLQENLAQVKNNSINKIANNLFNRFYADNTLDFINDNTFRLVLSQKENQSLKKLNVTENMDVSPQEINNHGYNATKEALREGATGRNSNLSPFQNSRGNGNQMLGEKPASSSTEILEDCKSETLYHQGMFLNNTDWKKAVNMEGENAPTSKEETLPYVKEQGNGNGHSES